MEQLNNKNLLNELNEKAIKNLQIIEELEKVNNIKEDKINDFKNYILKGIEKFTKEEQPEEQLEEEENNGTTKKASDNQIIKEELEKQKALFNLQSKELKKDFNNFTKELNFEIEQKDNNYNLKIYTNKEVVEELRRYNQIAVFNEKLEKIELSNNAIKRCFNYALHLALKKHYETILNDKENNKKEKSLNNYKINNAKLFNDFNEKVLFEYYIISEENNKKELKRIGTK